MAKKKQETLKDLKVVYRASDHLKVAKEIVANVKLEGTGEHNGHSFVDLGLPSGLLWATCNVGATNPEDYGDYFEWGDTETKDVYHYSNNRHYDAVNGTHTKYISKDGLVVLESNDDAATANWGNGWRMPTKEDVEELLNNCTNVLTTINGVDGHLFTGPNGNSIFLPAAGYRDGSELYSAGSEGHYWSSTPCIGDPFACVWYFYFELGDYTHNIADACRSFGYSVRAVCQPQK